jgi:hypothetical protein
MSMELFVILAATQAPDVEAWNKALAAASVPVSFVSADLSHHSGFLPATLKGEKTGLRSFSIASYSELVSYYPNVAAIKINNPVVYELGYAGDFLEAATVFYSASALVLKFGGTAFDPQGGIVMDAAALLEAAKQCEELARQGQ